MQDQEHRERTSLVRERSSALVRAAAPASASEEKRAVARHVSPHAQFIVFVVATVGWVVVTVVRTAQREWLVAALAIVAGMACALAAWRAAREE